MDTQGDNEVFNTPLAENFDTKPLNEVLDSELGPMIKAKLNEEEGVLLTIDNKEDIKPLSDG